MRGRALTTAGRARKDGWTATSSAHCSILMADTDSTPFRRFSQSASIVFAPGNLPAIPTTAISVPLTSFNGCIKGPPPAFASFRPHLSAVRASRQTRIRPLAGPDDPAQGTHRGTLEERGHRKLDRILPPQAPHEVDGEERVSAQLEDVVVQPHPFDPEHLAPESRQLPLHRILGGNVGRAHLRPRVPPGLLGSGAVLQPLHGRRLRPPFQPLRKGRGRDDYL